MAKTIKKTTDYTANDVNAVVGHLVERARVAQRVFDKYDQQQVDDVVTAVGWAIINPKNNRELAEMAVRDTGLGNVDDKIQKNHRKTKGLLRDLSGARTVGVVAEYPDLGIIEIARPVGVVGAIVPSTNPVATPFNKTINALKGRNAIILAPSPKAQHVCSRLVELIHQELDRIAAPCDLVQKLPEPVDKATTSELMRQVDLVVVTGSQNNVRGAYKSGTPTVGVGAGNVVSIIDDTADVDTAAAKIASSKTFDNATSCSSENSVVILDTVYEAALRALESNGGIILSADEKHHLQDAMWIDGKINREVIAKDAITICELAGLDAAKQKSPSFLMVEEQDIGPDAPFSDEKMSPVLTVYRARDFDEAYAITHRILEVQGLGHSVGIHTSDDAHVMRLGLEMPVCRVIVNQAHCFATGGNFDNGLPFSLSMGCGTWGQNSISDNMNYRHYLNTTRIARTIPTNEPSLQELFGEFWSKHGIRVDTGE
jgi:sulfoacetaldehyde dehydrogenase